MGDLIIIGIVVIPILLMTLLKINASFVYLSICLGFVLSSFTANNSTLNNLYTKNVNMNGNANTNIQIILILLPVIITMVLMIKSIPKSMLLINALMSIACGVLLVLIITPLLPSQIGSKVMNSTTWNQLKNFQDLIIGATSLFALATLALNRRSAHSHHGSKHGKK